MSPIHPENAHRYPDNWPAISAKIKERANWRCECLGECGTGHVPVRCSWFHGTVKPNGTRVVLTVAHLDHTPENCAPTNLKAMCQGCHLGYDMDHHRESKARRDREALENAGQITFL